LVYFTINLYNFILFILNNFFKKKLKIPIDEFTDGMYPSAFHGELKNITGNATITDGFTGGYRPSAFYQKL
jgi:hypothetical protein